jgi:hypothetical protein
MRERLDGSPCSIFVVWFLLFTFLVYMNTYYIYMYELFNFPCLGLFNILYLCFSKLECPKPVLVFLWSKLIKKLDDNLESPMTQPHIYIYIYIFIYIFTTYIYIYTHTYIMHLYTHSCVYIYMHTCITIGCYLSNFIGNRIVAGLWNSSPKLRFIIKQ